MNIYFHEAQEHEENITGLSLYKHFKLTSRPDRKLLTDKSVLTAAAFSMGLFMSTDVFVCQPRKLLRI